MEIIANKITIDEGSLGYRIRGKKVNFIGIPPKRQNGDIKGFSSASKRRLRETLAMSHTVTPSEPYGFCFTIPGDILTPGATREIWELWRKNYLMRKYSDCAFIWRIELQQRKQAHWHCVGYMSMHDEKLESLKVSPHNIALTKAQELKNDWFSFISNKVGQNWSEKTLKGASYCSCNVKPLSGVKGVNVVGYLADHTSKHKAQQLGWKGRQWGIVNKRLLSDSPSESVEIPLVVHIRACRGFKRLQERLRKRGGKYTGARISTLDSSCISHSLFGFDAERYLKILYNELKNYKMGEKCNIMSKFTAHAVM